MRRSCARRGESEIGISRGEKKHRDGCVLGAPHKKKIFYLINHGALHLKLFNTSFISKGIDCISACLTTEVTKKKKHTWIDWLAVAMHYVALAYFVVVGEQGEDFFFIILGQIVGGGWGAIEFDS